MKMHQARFWHLLSIVILEAFYGLVESTFISTPQNPTYFTPSESVSLRWIPDMSVNPVVISFQKYDPIYNVYDVYAEYVIPIKQLTVHIHQSRIDMYDQATFRINNTVASDAGRYKCKVTTNSHHFESVVDLSIAASSTTSSAQYSTHTALSMSETQSMQAVGATVSTSSISGISHAGSVYSTSFLGTSSYNLWTTISEKQSSSSYVQSPIVTPTSASQSQMANSVTGVSSVVNLVQLTSTSTAVRGSTTALTSMSSSKSLSASTSVHDRSQSSQPTGTLLTLSGTSSYFLTTTSRTEGPSTQIPSDRVSSPTISHTTDESRSINFHEPATSISSVKSASEDSSPSLWTQRQVHGTVTHMMIGSTNIPLSSQRLQPERTSLRLSTAVESLTGVNATQIESASSISIRTSIQSAITTSQKPSTTPPKLASSNLQTRNKIIGIAVGVTVAALIIFVAAIYILKSKVLPAEISPS